MRHYLEEAAKRASDLTVENNDFGCYISVRPYGFLVDATKEVDDKIIRKVRVVPWEIFEGNLVNPLLFAIDSLVAELQQ